MSASSSVYQIPEKLKAEKAGVLWRRESRDGKPTKVLYQASHGRADSTAGRTWTTFEDAVEASEQDDFFDGVGFVFHPDNLYCGANIDDVTEDEARRWIERFDSYTERSPSGNGFHIICKAEVPKGTNRAEGELYSSGRFFTMTGDVGRGAPVREAQDAADEFYKFLRRGEQESAPAAASVSTLTDVEVVRLAENAKNGAEFSVAYQGGGQFKSGSERDLSLASRLAFWTQDEAQIERIMLGSGCVREKWSKRRTYLRDTIRKARSGLTETYTAPGEAAPYRIKAVGDDKTTESPQPPSRPARFERIDLGEPIESGIEPPERLVPDELYAGRVHCIYSAGGSGKTFKALQLVKKLIDQGKPVLLLDLENGVRIISERLRDLGAKADQVRQHLYYYPFPSMPLSDDASSEFEALLEEIKPSLVVIDSWINCISVAGLDENGSTDIARWTDAYPQRAWVRGIASLLLDHVPKEGNTEHGSGRKLDYVDAMWELRNPQKFDRETVGRIDMHLRKDREGWLPRALTFSVGAGEDGFIFKQIAGTVGPLDEAGLTTKERSTFEAPQALGSLRAFDREWKEEAATRDVKKSKYYEAKKRLLDLNLVEKVMKKYFAKDLQNRGPDKSSGLQTDHAGVSSPEGPVVLRTGPSEPPVDKPDEHPLDCLCDECVPT
jgi:hypothetical protein